ncbi:phasin family protein [Methylosinus sp. KRF6]|uniref:phasin family protein n=1 Tax=Methylosinus sp. KRF6 TaxID=2846853 RepID=UPI001C0B6AE7|nr:phasin family protein [Methylosinus sp. KRF6]MBU3887997.1 phasin family protein [Methylosinus sp. KRF6]
MADLYFDTFREFGNSQIEAFNSATNSTAKSVTAIGAEATEYSKQSLDKGRAYFEKLLQAQKLDEIVQLQSDFCWSAYGDFFTHASRIGELCTGLANEAVVSAQTVKTPLMSM